METSYENIIHSVKKEDRYYNERRITVYWA